MAIAEMLDKLEAHMPPSSSHIPEEYISIRNMFQEAKDNGEKVLVENTELGYAYSVVVKLDYIGTRWCTGYVRYPRVEGVEYVPYTISYADIYTSKYKNSTSKNLTVKFRKENPFDNGT